MMESHEHPPDVDMTTEKPTCQPMLKIGDLVKTAQMDVYPPSTGKQTPVTNADASDNNHATPSAIFHG